jgi:hypothetical protein
MQVRGSSRPPKSDTSVLVHQLLSEELAGVAGIDGIMLLIDACSSGNVPKSTIDALGEVAGGRLEVLTAATFDAYDGCFTRALIGVLRHGVAWAGDYVHPFAAIPAVASACTAQTPTHVSYNSGRSNSAGVFDEGLWLVPNAARARHALTGRPDSGRVDQLLRGVTLSNSQLSLLQEVSDGRGERLRLITGPPGSGKSTVSAALVAPPMGVELAVNVGAAVFIDSTVTPDALVVELSAQLAQNVRGFAAAAIAITARIKEGELAAAELNILDQLVILPARMVMTSSSPAMDIVVDAIDQANPRYAAAIHEIVWNLITAAGAEKMRVIVTGRAHATLTARFGGQSAFELPAPSNDEVSNAAGLQADYTDVHESGWLIARLATGLDRIPVEHSLGALTRAHVTQAVGRIGEARGADVAGLIHILLAGGQGPVMPLDVLVEALGELGSITAVAEIRTVLATLGPLVQRSRPGEPDEHVGLSHARIAESLRTPTSGVGGDEAIARALDRLCNAENGPWSGSIFAYAREAWPIHALAIPDTGMTLRALIRTVDPTAPRSNYERIATHLPRISAIAGPDHSDTLATRSQLAYWRAAAGDVGGAVIALEQLLADRVRILGTEHRDTLTTQVSLARWRGEMGDPGGAVSALEDLLTDHMRMFGPDDIDTLTARFTLAMYRGRAGDPAGAATSFEDLLVDQLRVLGPDHPNTLATRGNLARWRGEAGNASGAVSALDDLLVDQLRVLGPDHPNTLATRGNLARWRGEAGNASGAVSALEDLLSDQLRVLGPDHPNTLATRSNLARWRGRAGDAAGAAAILDDLLMSQLRVLDTDHPNVLATRNNLARWRGETGDAAGALAAFEDLLESQLRVLGADHLNTFATRANLARWRGETGDPAGAATAFESLLADELRVLGADHPSTLLTRSNLARWRGNAGDARGAAAALEELLADQLRVLGRDHPSTLLTRSNLARWRGRAGDARGAAAALQELLSDQVRILGSRHPHTLTTRNHLAKWRARAIRK